MSKAFLEPASSELIAILDTINARLRWLASWTIHNANHLRDDRNFSGCGVFREGS